MAASEFVTVYARALPPLSNVRDCRDVVHRPVDVNGHRDASDSLTEPCPAARRRSPTNATTRP